jgi:endogenous inhibitor of DNA gyrase (YacG/DUF329 family)
MDATTLRLCPTCARLFLIEHGRQRFCSFKCKNSEAQHRFRAKQRPPNQAPDVSPAKRGRSPAKKSA